MFSALFLSFIPLLAGAAGDPAEPDLVVLLKGDEINCRVMYEDDEEVVYRVKRREKRVPRSEVLDVHTLERSMREFLTRLDEVALDDPAALSELAAFAEESFLLDEARNLWIRILLLEPEHPQAWTKLGGVKGRKGWQLEVRGRYYGIDELRRRASDWKNALELSTAHFLIRTDGDPLRALNASIDVERAYQAFYDVIGKPLKLFVFDEEPEIHVFADHKDYPTPPNGTEKVWFSPNANELYVDASAEPSPSEVVSELTDALIFNAFRRSADTKTGEIEPWARQGLMSAFAIAVRPDPGRVRFEFEPPYRPWFEQAAHDKEPIELARVLTAGRGAFNAGAPDAERYTVGAYTLVHFLVFHEGGKYRPAFASFLRDSFLGKGGKAKFLESAGVKEDALEAEWRRYIQTLAGA